MDARTLRLESILSLAQTVRSGLARMDTSYTCTIGSNSLFATSKLKSAHSLIFTVLLSKICQGQYLSLWKYAHLTSLISEVSYLAYPSHTVAFRWQAPLSLYPSPSLHECVSFEIAPKPFLSQQALQIVSAKYSFHLTNI